MDALEFQNIRMIVKPSQKISVNPPCSVFNQCGGCLYQDIPYEQELYIKENNLRNVLNKKIKIKNDAFLPIVASPKEYHYRNRLDLKLKRTKNKEIFIGFNPLNGKGIVPVNECFIAIEEISDFIPDLKKQAAAKLPEKKYSQANLVLRTGDEKKVFWGGIGRKSNRLSKEDYFSTNINGRKIFYSLDTFFQANLSILPKLIEIIRSFDIWQDDCVVYDIYGGVGFFGILISDIAGKVILIEECKNSIEAAKHNIIFNGIENFEIITGKTEDVLGNLLSCYEKNINIAMIDPPRSGLSESAINLFTRKNNFNFIIYLSCNPDALASDLINFAENKWVIKKIIPFDFFPKTKHLETLVLMERSL